jgi:hypothetical protein
MILGFGLFLHTSMAEENPSVPITLVTDGKPNSTIVVAENPTPSVNLATLEFQYHIKKITGAALPVKTDVEEVNGVRILIGESQYTRKLSISVENFSPQEYLIQFQPNTIIMIGRDWQDTEENRKELGSDTYGRKLKSSRHEIDYHKPTGQNEQVTKPITLPGFFDDQGTCYAVYHFLEKFCGVRWYGPTELNVVFPALKTLTVQGDDVRRTPDLKHRHAIGGGWPIIKVQWNDPNSDELNLYWRRMRVGGEKWAGNHTIWRHTVASVFNDPEYQAKGRGKGSQLCYTNQKLVQKVAQVARDFFDGKALPEGLKAMGDYFAVVPDDNAAWCECDQCKEVLAVSKQDKRGKGYFSNARNSYYIFSFINQVAKAVRKTHPDKYIAALAYASYAYPPKGLELESNISIAPCLHTCYGYDRGTTENDMALYGLWVNQERRIYLWNYFHHPMEPAVIQGWNCFPCFMPDFISHAVKRYHEDGVRGIFLCGIGQQLDYYLYMQTAFDVNTDYEELIDEFFSRYFGAASEPMKQFYYRISDINRAEGVVGTSQEISWNTLGTHERMKELERYIEEAVDRASTDLERRRVDTWKVGVWEYMKAGSEAKLFGNDIRIAARTGNMEAIRKYLAMDMDINAPDSEFGVTLLTWAALFGQTEIIELLIQKGADVNAKNRNGTTPLHGAVFLGQTEAVELLIQKGADANARTNEGATPLDISVMDWETTESVAAFLKIKMDKEKIRTGRAKITSILSKQNISR